GYIALFGAISFASAAVGYRLGSKIPAAERDPAAAATPAPTWTAARQRGR
ncbi:MAG: hypothetical protein IRY94_07580, partial [Rhodospirillaceae bacterium]|nr:hypothetical protein [Rhodospirillaceae bacterium]